MTRLVAAKDIGNLLGVSRQRVQQLTAQDGFPKPYAVVAEGSIRVWRRSDVEKWAEKRSVTR